MNGYFICTNKIYGDQMRTTLRVHEQERRIFTVHKWEQTILWCALYKYLTRNEWEMEKKEWEMTKKWEI